MHEIRHGHSGRSDEDLGLWAVGARAHQGMAGADSRGSDLRRRSPARPRGQTHLVTHLPRLASAAGARQVCFPSLGGKSIAT